MWSVMNSTFEEEKGGEEEEGEGARGDTNQEV